MTTEKKERADSGAPGRGGLPAANPGVAGRPVLIYESSVDGHRVRYLEYLLRELAGRGRKTVLVLPRDAWLSAELRGCIEAFPGSVELDCCIPEHPSGGWKNVAVRSRSLSEAIRRKGPAQVIIPSGDQLAQVLWWFWFSWWRPAVRRSTFDVVLLRLRWGSSPSGVGERIRRLVTFLTLAVSPCRRIWSIDDQAVNRMRRWPLWGRRLRYLPDPIENLPLVEKVLARRELGLPTEGPLLGTVGILDGRKGVDRLIRSFVRIADRTNAQLVLAGPADPEARTEIERMRSDPKLAGRLSWTDRSVTERELNLFLDALDLVCLPYVDHQGPSSIVLKAAAARKWILGCNTGWIGATILAHRLGWVCDPRNPEDLSGKLLQGLETLERTGGANYDTAWVHAHDSAKFAKLLVGD